MQFEFAAERFGEPCKQLVCTLRTSSDLMAPPLSLQPCYTSGALLQRLHRQGTASRPFPETMNAFPLERSEFVPSSMTAVATSDEVGGERHAREEVGRGYAEIAGIARDRMFSDVGVRHDARRKRHELQAASEPIRFLLTVARDEHLRALGAGISSPNRRPCDGGAAGDQDDRGACRQRPRQRRLAEVKRDLDVGLPVDGEFPPCLLVNRRGWRKRACTQNQDIGWRTSNTFEGAPSSVASSDRTSAPATSRANCRSGASCRATASTCAPLRTPASTIRRPTPRLPPITTMVLPVNESISSSWLPVGGNAHLISKTGAEAGTHRCLKLFLASTRFA